MKQIKISTIDKEGKMDEISIDGEIFAVGASNEMTSQAVRNFLSNQRKAKAVVETRANVTGTGAKIWRQKGTGRARHGDKQAPIFVGGGVVHGPTGLQNYKKGMNKKMMQRTMLSVIAQKIADKRFFLADEMKLTKTKEASDFLQKTIKGASLEKAKIGFIVEKKDNYRRFLRNIKNTSVFDVNSLHPYLLLNCDLLLFSQNAFKTLSEKAKNFKKNQKNDEH